MYKLTNTETITRLADGASIPADHGNSDFQQYLKWRDGWTQEIRDMVTGELIETIVHAPNTPYPAEPMQNTALRITMAQARVELAESNMLDAFDAYIASLPRPDQIRWEYETFVERNNPLVVRVLKAKGISDADADAMFLRASNR